MGSNMAKFLVTNFTPETGGEVTASGIIYDGDKSFVFSAWNVPFDAASATPIRQQIDTVLADVVNEQIKNYGQIQVVLTQADIEYLT